LITGAGGFAGSYLAEECVRRGWSVHGTTRPANGAHVAGPGITLHSVELTDAAAVHALMERVRPEQIYHLAAQPSVQKAWQDPLSTLTNNIGAQLQVLTAVREVCPTARALVVSSSEVYGRIDAARDSVDEATPFGPLDPYSVSKVSQEMLALQHYLAFDMRIVRVRPFNHTGPRQSTGFVAPDFARQIALIEAGLSEPVIRVGNLEAVRDISDVRDVVRAYTLALCGGEAGTVYNVASGRGISVSDLLQSFLALARVMISVEVDSERLRPIDRPRIVGDATKLRRATGWEPSIPFEQTVRETLNYWRSRVATGG
jgi:GDP-4-dehydro-6-deoxy-D-mannose reductase